MLSHMPSQECRLLPWSDNVPPYTPEGAEQDMYPLCLNAQLHTGGVESRTVEKWCWDAYIAAHDSVVRVALSGAGVQDADLGSLTGHLEALLLRRTARSSGDYSLSIDLSCNWGISDYGVANHLAPFLRRWPVCRRLKLYQTSIGDRALGELSDWVAEGYAYELHLSDLGGPVSGEAVLKFLQKVHEKGRYPYWLRGGGHSPLWLRLEHNRIPRVDEVVARSLAEGISLRVLSKADLPSVRPGAPTKGRRVPAMHLVLFRLQHSKAPPPEDRLTCGQKLLMMLQENAPALERGAFRQEPQPLSNDEFRLWQMEAREDLERGDDKRNKETFGDDTAAGWSFEENLAANERLASQAWTKAAMDMLGVYPQVGAAHFAGTATADAFRELSGSYEADSASICSSRGRHVLNAARCEVDEEIYNVLALNPTLQKPDFDGRVRQYLHAIRNSGGKKRVREAMRVLHAATIGKTRQDINKWPAYLVALLKRYQQGLFNKEEPVRFS